MKFKLLFVFGLALSPAAFALDCECLEGSSKVVPLGPPYAPYRGSDGSCLQMAERLKCVFPSEVFRCEAVNLEHRTPDGGEVTLPWPANGLWKRANTLAIPSQGCDPQVGAVPSSEEKD